MKTQVSVSVMRNTAIMLFLQCSLCLICMAGTPPAKKPKAKTLSKVAETSECVSDNNSCINRANKIGFPFCNDGCPDDYNKKPWCPSCRVPYTVDYRCVPAGETACTNFEPKSKYTWWFLPKPKSLRDALWMSPRESH